MSNLLENLILSPPVNLCFNCHEFTKDSFSVEQFLQEHRNMANLETMRDDLGIYLKTLRSAMIELINKDYADFVNLSSNLIGLDKAITSIQLPLGQLKEELLVVQQNIDDAVNDVFAQLLKHKKIQERKQSLKSLNKVHYSLNKLNYLFNEVRNKQCVLKPLQLERAAMEYNQLQFHLSRCIGDVSDTDKQCFEEIGRTLHKHLDDQFVECQKKEKEDQLFRILGIYLALGKNHQAEQSYRKEKVSPIVSKLINEDALSSNPRGLAGVYDSLIAFIDDEMKILRSVTQSFDKLGKTKGFDFIVNSFWPEVEEHLELNLSSIYAPGNPDHFYMCYSGTLQFLDKLESRCDRKILHQHPQYQSFMQRWNLPVYFQIRFQEIAGSVEVALISINVYDTSTEWKLVATNTVWQSLMRCWQDKVFIAHLTHRFWKLNLQILARYYTWINELIEQKNEDIQLTVEFWVFLYSDVALLTERLDQLFIHANQHLHPKVTQNMRDQLQKCINEWKDKLLPQLDAVSLKLVHRVCMQSMAALRQVSEVPRLYRRTNREAPTKSLSYIDAMLESPFTFYSHHKSHPHVATWLQSVFSEITKQYYGAVMDVLTSVQKTEESLRRLKKIRDKSTVVGSTSDRGGDDDKIRMQLYFDANYYCKKIEEVGIQKENIKQLKDLLQLVETLHNKNGFK